MQNNHRGYGRGNGPQTGPNGEIIERRLKLPRGKEVIGIIDQRVGGSRMLVKCSDGITRNCRVPGRLKRSLWLREGDVVIVEPWEFDNEKGDVLFKYPSNHASVLREKGFLKNIDAGF